MKRASLRATAKPTKTTRLLVDSVPRSLLVDGARIAAKGIAAVGTKRLECTWDEVIARPGDVNAHTHLYSGLAPLGMPEPKKQPKTFVQILERVWWRLDRALDEKSLRAAARLYIAESLSLGTTFLVDHHESPNFIDGSLDVLADAAEELGCRMVLCYGATERNGGRREAKAGLAECRRFIKKNKRTLVRGMVGLHAGFTATDETIEEAGALARELGVGIHVHVAEDGVDVEDARERGYRDPVDRLIALGALPEGSILAHGVHLDEKAVKRAAEQGAWLIQNPRSNRNNRVGWPYALWKSDKVAIGTDGFPPDMDAERQALLDIGGDAQDRKLLPGGKSGSRYDRRCSAGWELAREQFGAPFTPLEAGAIADIAVYARHDMPGLPTELPLHVVVGGRVALQDWKLVRGDFHEIAAEARSEAKRLWKRMDKL
jgi:cytosine/adenosine deaminase-related metal-dependent hydrolase